jgi:hypothetical protein
MRRISAVASRATGTRVAGTSENAPMSAASLRRCGVAGISALRQAAANHPDRYARDRALEALTLEAASSRRLAAA